MTDEEYMRKALAEAEQAAKEDEIPIGAVLVCRGRIIARTHNLTETLCDVTAHAEMQAITAGANALGGKYLTDCTLYVTVELVRCVPELSVGHRFRESCMVRPMRSVAIVRLLLMPCIQRLRWLAVCLRMNVGN